jgi:oligopeptidase B
MTPDPNQWLEDVEGSKQLEWVRARNAESVKAIAQTPGFAETRDYLRAILDSDAKIPTVEKLGNHYYNFWKDKQHVAGLWRRTTPAEYRKAKPAWEPVIDLDALNAAEKANFVWHGATCLPPRYRRCLVALSRGGADADETREFDLEAKAFVKDGFFRPEAKGSLTWRDADSVYVGTDFGPGSMTTSGYARIVKLWRRGTPMSSATTVFEANAKDLGVWGFRDHAAGFERDYVWRGFAFYNNELYLLDKDGKPQRLDLPNSADKNVHREWLTVQLREPLSEGGRTYPAGSLLATRLDAFQQGRREWEVLFTPTPTTSLAAAVWTRDYLLLNLLEDVKSRIEVLYPRAGGWDRSGLDVDEDIVDLSVVAVDADTSNEYFLTATSFLHPTSLSLGEAGLRAPELLKQLPAWFDATGMQASQHFATSKDGTRVPYFMVAKKDLELDGSTPTLLYGYGGFEVSETPGYSGSVGRWVGKGNVYVLANIRGGGEYGPAWHRAALRENRNKAYEDFAAVAQDLIARKVTSTPHLGIQGGSNGGLLMGNMLVMYPHLFGAIVCQVPLLDMQRYSHLLAGASWMAEYGDPDVPADWAFLQKYSPYHNVRKDVDYPPVLFTTSTRDDRVHPGHARKMTARMLEQGHEVLYYENIEGGHGGAANNEQAAFMQALSWTFLEQKLSGPIPAARTAGMPKPPVAETRAHDVKAPFGATRADEYYWLRDDTREDPRLLAYLAEENSYADAILASSARLKDKLYEEIVGRIKQDDSSVPYRLRGYWYYSRYETGKDYPVLARRAGSMDGAEEVLLDENAMAAGHGFFSVGEAEVSQDNRLLAWAEDTVGRRQYVLKVKEIATGRVLEDTIPNIEANLVWGDDNKTLFYVEKDPVTLLSKRVKKHVLGTPHSADTLVYEEKDESYYMHISRTRDDRYLCIDLDSTVSTEVRCTPAANPGEFAVIAPRQRDFEYQADHLDGRWVIRTNWDAKNFRLMQLADGQAWGDRARWQPLVPHSEEVYIEDFELFDGFVAIEERSGGLLRVRTLKADGGSEFVAADEPAYAMSLSVNAEPDTTKLRYSYDSLTTPHTQYEVDTATGERTLLKRDPVLGGYDPSNYVTERVWAQARDGTRIPVSVVYRKGFKKDGTAAMLQYAYGSYGLSMDPAFSVSTVSLLDRGVVYALAHIRGGQEMGRAWYDDGHLLNKKNSFTDFIDVTHALVQQGYAAPGRVAARGGSAGGLLMGAVANMAPQDYRVIIAQVPFVDVVTTMLDESIPLTTNEFDEWGNPADRKFYDYMLSYSPYDQVKRQDYPAMFVGTGLWDSQVQYFEPTKWVARLRTHKTDSNPLVYRINMEAGHGGKSGRFEKYRETAEYYAFMLEQLGITE